MPYENGARDRAIAGEGDRPFTVTLDTFDVPQPETVTSALLLDIVMALPVEV